MRIKRAHTLDLVVLAAEWDHGRRPGSCPTCIWGRWIPLPGSMYVRPELVVEVAFSDLQESSRYPGGLALRLARVKRYREDKPTSAADNMDSVRRIHAAQSGIG